MITSDDQYCPVPMIAKTYDRLEIIPGNAGSTEMPAVGFMTALILSFRDFLSQRHPLKGPRCVYPTRIRLGPDRVQGLL